jgi:cytochrome c553
MDCARKMNKLLTAVFALAVACVTAASSAQEIKGDAAAGAKKVSMCIGCHGIPEYKASFPEVYEVPKIAGQSADYLMAALNEYKTGDRKFPTMRAIAGSLSEQDIADVAAYYSTQGVVAGHTVPDKPSIEPGPQVAAILAKANCAACHGANFDKPIAPNYPKLAGQHASYLLMALKQYKAGTSNPHFGRGNPIMGAMAKQFSDADLKAVANYIGSLPGDVKTVTESRFK